MSKDQPKQKKNDVLRKAKVPRTPKRVENGILKTGHHDKAAGRTLKIKKPEPSRPKPVIPEEKRLVRNWAREIATQVAIRLCLWKVLGDMGVDPPEGPNDGGLSEK